MSELVSSHRFDAFTSLAEEIEAATTKHSKVSTMNLVIRSWSHKQRTVDGVNSVAFQRTLLLSLC